MISATAAAYWLGAIAARGGRYARPDSRRRPGRAWSAIGVVATFLAIQTFYAGARRIGAAQAALVSTIEPLDDRPRGDPVRPDARARRSSSAGPSSSSGS